MKLNVLELIDEIRNDARSVGCELIIQSAFTPSGQTLLVIIPDHPYCAEQLTFGFFNGVGVSIASRLTNAQAKRSTYYKKLTELHDLFQMAKPDLYRLAQALRSVDSGVNQNKWRDYQAVEDAWQAGFRSVRKH